MDKTIIKTMKQTSKYGKNVAQNGAGKKQCPVRSSSLRNNSVQIYASINHLTMHNLLNFEVDVLQ